MPKVLSALDRGNANRAKAATNMNEHSSRSHAVLRLEVATGAGAAATRGSLCLVDLAGSERVARSAVRGAALQEARHINKSLAALGNVMEALDRKARHVPYRDSKLTYLLQDALGGHARTMMIVAVNPHPDSIDETLGTLKFAARVRSIDLGPAQKNSVASMHLEETVRRLTSQVETLTQAKERVESELLRLRDRTKEPLSGASPLRPSSGKEEVRPTELAVCKSGLPLLSSHPSVIRQYCDVAKRKQTLALVQGSENKENICFHPGKGSSRKHANKKDGRPRERKVLQSRIPKPNKARSQRSLNLQKPHGVRNQSSIPASSGICSSTKVGSKKRKLDMNVADVPDSTAHVKSRLIQLLQVHDPSKVGKIDSTMAKFEGRETELLHKMLRRYQGTGEATSGATMTKTTAVSNTRPRSRQDEALERHKTRMKRMKTSAGKD